jgi:large subunit ribosomal protein L18
MKLKISKHTSERKINRIKKKTRIRKIVKGTDERPRLCVFRSNAEIYAQIVNDMTGKTLVSFSSLSLEGKVSGKEQAKQVGLGIAKVAQAAKVKNVVFDRNGYVYHGRVQSLADGAREGGLNF